MNKWLLGLIVVVVLAGLILVLIKRLQTSGSGVLYRSRELMTPNEIEFFGRLNRALPGLNVFPQVSMAALIEPTATKRTARWTAAFNRIQAKRVDFVIADQMGKVRAVVESDDRTHNSQRTRTVTQCCNQPDCVCYGGIHATSQVRQPSQLRW